MKKFEDLVIEVKDLSAKDIKSISEKGLKFMEEAGEVAEAILSYNKAGSCGYKGKSLEDLQGELGDVLNCIIDLAVSSGIEPEAVVDTALLKCKKWRKNIAEDVLN